jgi:hypothetical protein
MLSPDDLKLLLLTWAYRWAAERTDTMTELHTALAWFKEHSDITEIKRHIQTDNSQSIEINAKLTLEFMC